MTNNSPLTTGQQQHWLVLGWSCLSNCSRLVSDGQCPQSSDDIPAGGSLSRDRKRPRVTKCTHSRVVCPRLEGNLVSQLVSLVLTEAVDILFCEGKHCESEIVVAGQNGINAGRQVDRRRQNRRKIWNGHCSAWRHQPWPLQRCFAFLYLHWAGLHHCWESSTGVG